MGKYYFNSKPLNIKIEHGDKVTLEYADGDTQLSWGCVEAILAAVELKSVPADPLGATLSSTPTNNPRVSTFNKSTPAQMPVVQATHVEWDGSTLDLIIQEGIVRFWPLSLLVAAELGPQHVGTWEEKASAMLAADGERLEWVPRDQPEAPPKILWNGWTRGPAEFKGIMGGPGSGPAPDTEGRIRAEFGDDTSIEPGQNEDGTIGDTGRFL